MNLIDGKALAAKMQAELKVKVDKLKEAGSVPGLAVILVGEDPASQIYVRNKARQATAIGLNSSVVRLPETVSEKELLELIEQYNQSEQWHGILVQLPLPKHISEEKVLLAIDPEKDVDGFHPMNMGRLW
ncbi:MAG: tetrahydrofolate dehydrogenase/cyclohydrolase catalytic domain-containing protein, partial [Lactococcus cremoris]